MNTHPHHAVKFAFIEAHRIEFKVTIMYRVLGVSRSGYYAWLILAPTR
jgi:hypothetical protein